MERKGTGVLHINPLKSTSKTTRKLGTLADLSKRLGTDRDGVMTWAKKETCLETLKYKSETEDAVGYLFLQSVYYCLKMDSICRKTKSRYKLFLEKAA